MDVIQYIIERQKARAKAQAANISAEAAKTNAQQAQETSGDAYDAAAAAAENARAAAEAVEEAGEYASASAISSTIFDTEGLAPVFDPEESYSAGDYVIYENVLYRFDADHTGAWSTADTTATYLSTDVSELMEHMVIMPTDAEAWAVGKRSGVDVGELDPTYHNNSLYYAQQSAAGAAAASSAQGYAEAAAQSAASVSEAAEQIATNTSDIADLEEAVDNINDSIGSINDSIDDINAWIDGGGGGSVSGDFEIVESQTGLAASTANNVLVLKNNSLYGDNGACLFTAKTGVDRYGYLRTSDGKYMVPAADQAPIAMANPPIEALMSVIKTWVGNANVKHLTAGSIDEHSLFGTTCSQTDGYWSMDCSAFTSAVLMGITYDNSRCVLGNSANNIPGDYFVGNTFPASQYLPARAKGGLSAAETAMWLAEHKRLYSFPEDPAEALAQLQFGDIIFGSNDIYPRYYNSIEHIMIVLGTVPSQGAVIVAESIDLDYAQTYYEQIGAHIAPVLLRDSTTGKTSSYYRVWGRPDYSHIGHKRDLLIPKGAGTFTYNPFFLDASVVCRGSSDSSTVPGGKLMLDRYSAGTPDFYPAIPGSVVSYTGASSCSRGVYLCRVHEFDGNYKLIKSTTIAYATNGTPATNPVTIGSTTRYLKFSFGLQSNTMSDTSVGIWLSNIDDCEITMTLPSA